MALSSQGKEPPGKPGRFMPPEDRQAIKAMLDGMIVKHRTKQIVGELRS